MQLQQAIDGRRSVRKFKDTPVSPDLIRVMADAASMAPSWKNSQVTRYYAVTDPQRRARLADMMPRFNKPACQSAPVIVVTTMVRNRSGYERDGSFSTAKGKGWQMYDAGCSNLIFCLKAYELGLATVIMGYSDEALVTDIIDLPETEEVCTIIALGYPDEAPATPKRKGSDVILRIL